MKVAGPDTRGGPRPIKQQVGEDKPGGLKAEVRIGRRQAEVDDGEEPRGRQGEALRAQGAGAGQRAGAEASACKFDQEGGKRVREAGHDMHRPDGREVSVQ